MRKAMQLVVLFVITPVFIVFAVLHGVWDWLCEIRQVGWRTSAMLRAVRIQCREILDPGVHLREAIEAKMPNKLPLILLAFLALGGCVDDPTPAKTPIKIERLDDREVAVAALYIVTLPTGERVLLITGSSCTTTTLLPPAPAEKVEKP